MKITIEIFKQEVKNVVGDEYEVLEMTYKNNSTPMLLKHNICGNIFKMSRKAFLNGQRCPNERYLRSAESNSKKQGKSEEKKKIIEEICEKEGYLCLSNYSRSKKPIVIKHLKCGKEFYPTPYDFIKGTRCPHCYRSKGEEVIREFLTLSKFVFEEQYRIKECRNKRPLPFDFAIFNEEKDLVCLMEYDGSQHFSNKFAFNDDEENFKKTKTNDKIKNEFCKRNNIPLIRIKFVRTDIKDYKNKIIDKVKEKFEEYNMAIPSQAIESQ